MTQLIFTYDAPHGESEDFSDKIIDLVSDSMISIDFGYHSVTIKFDLGDQSELEAAYTGERVLNHFRPGETSLDYYIV